MGFSGFLGGFGWLFPDFSGLLQCSKDSDPVVTLSVMYSDLRTYFCRLLLEVQLLQKPTGLGCRVEAVHVGFAMGAARRLY